MSQHYSTDSLDKPVTSQERKAFYRVFSIGLFSRLGVSVLGVVLFFIVNFAMSVLVIPGSVGDHYIAKWLAVGSAVTIGVGGFLTVAYLQRKVNTRVKLWRFAQVNGLEFITLLPRDFLIGSPFRAVDDRAKIQDVIKDESSLLPWLIGRFSFVIGEGKQQTSHQRHFIQLTLSRKLPHIVLRNRKAFSADVLAMTGVDFMQSQRIKLEGDFSSRFDVYCPKGYERDLLYIFTPDLMEKIGQIAESCDIEIIDDKFFIYTKELQLGTSKNMQQILGAIDYLDDKLKRQTKHYKDDRSAHKAYAKATQKGVIDITGQQLAKAFDLWPYIEGALIAGFFIAIGLLLFRM